MNEKHVDICRLVAFKIAPRRIWYILRLIQTLAVDSQSTPFRLSYIQFKSHRGAWAESVEHQHKVRKGVYIYEHRTPAIATEQEIVCQKWWWKRKEKMEKKLERERQGTKICESRESRRRWVVEKTNCESKFPTLICQVTLPILPRR